MSELTFYETCKLKQRHFMSRDLPFLYVRFAEDLCTSQAAAPEVNSLTPALLLSPSPSPSACSKRQLELRPPPLASSSLSAMAPPNSGGLSDEEIATLVRRPKSPVRHAGQGASTLQVMARRAAAPFKDQLAQDYILKPWNNSAFRHASFRAGPLRQFVRHGWLDRHLNTSEIDSLTSKQLSSLSIADYTQTKGAGIPSPYHETEILPEFQKSEHVVYCKFILEIKKDGVGDAFVGKQWSDGFSVDLGAATSSDTSSNVLCSNATFWKCTRRSVQRTLYKHLELPEEWWRYLEHNFLYDRLGDHLREGWKGEGFPWIGVFNLYANKNHDTTAYQVLGPTTLIAMFQLLQPIKPFTLGMLPIPSGLELSLMSINRSDIWFDRYITSDSTLPSQSFFAGPCTLLYLHIKRHFKEGKQSPSPTQSWKLLYKDTLYGKMICIGVPREALEILIHPASTVFWSPASRREHLDRTGARDEWFWKTHNFKPKYFQREHYDPFHDPFLEDYDPTQEGVVWGLKMGWAITYKASYYNGLEQEQTVLFVSLTKKNGDPIQHRIDIESMTDDSDL